MSASFTELRKKNKQKNQTKQQQQKNQHKQKNKQNRTKQKKVNIVALEFGINKRIKLMNLHMRNSCFENF